MPTPNGPRNQPRYDLQDDSDFSADLTQVSDWAARYASELILTDAQRAALEAADLTTGLRVTNPDATNPSESQSYRTPGGWVPSHAGVSAVVALGALYAAYPGAYVPTARRAAGRVNLDGTATAPNDITFSPGVTYTLGTIPVGFRPQAQVYGVPRFGTAQAVVTVQPGGAILFSVPGGAQAPAGTLIFSLHGITWPML